MLPGRLDAAGMRQALAELLRRNPASPFRAQDAARHLGAGSPARLPDAICAFAGEPAPAGPLTRRLAAGAFAVLGSVPRGILMARDLAGTAGDRPGAPGTLPPTPREAVILVDALAGLGPPDGRRAARQPAVSCCYPDPRPALAGGARATSACQL